MMRLKWDLRENDRMATNSFPIDLEHAIYGSCRLLRVEGMNWVIEISRTRTQLRIPSTRREEFSIVKVDSPSSIPVAATNCDAVKPPIINAGNKNGLIIDRSPTSPVITPVQVSSAISHDKLRLRKAIESLRNGLPPVNVDSHKLAVGLDDLEHEVEGLLTEVGGVGGSVKIVRGGYGQGKSLSLNLAAELALQKGFWVVQTEVDATERRLDKPNNIYRSLMQSLRIPGAQKRGVSELAAKISAITRPRAGTDGNHYHHNITCTRMWLDNELQCPPLAWLLSDPDLQNKEMLRGLLSGDAGWSIAGARKQHPIPGTPRDWPKFSAGSQGDFACFLISGLGRLSRLLGSKGLVVILDEMEKWQDLSWNQQTRAGNLIGGLIWGATEQVGRRDRHLDLSPNHHQPQALQHSGRAGGFPFTTIQRAHLGIIIALTPRGEFGPENLWRQFGPVSIFDLPEFTQEKFNAYTDTVGTHYAMAYDLPKPDNQNVFRRAHKLWCDAGDGSTRTAVRSTIQALDEWRRASAG